MEQVDNFQPLAIIKILRNHMSDLQDQIRKSGGSDVWKEGVISGLAWAIVEVQHLAMAKDRFVAKS